MKLAVLAVYLPPGGAVVKVLHSSVKSTLSWIHMGLDRIGRTCSPLFIGDLNCAFGIRTVMAGRKCVKLSGEI
eukprot:1996277-Pyramimonas_sp.AAC.1